MTAPFPEGEMSKKALARGAVPHMSRHTQPFVAGEAFSMADITVIAGLIFAGIVKLPAPAECEALQAWYARMQERPSVRNRVTMFEPAR